MAAPTHTGWRAIPLMRIGFAFVLSAASLALSSCESGGHFCVLGYTTRPNYDEGIRTVYVPIFKNLTLWRGLEFDLTRAVVRQIELKTPYKVVSDRCTADTELKGTIISLNKLILNRNQLNEVREAETTLAVEIEWRDLRTGEILSQPRRPGAVPLPAVDGPPDAAPPVNDPLPPGAPPPISAPTPPPGLAPIVPPPPGAPPGLGAPPPLTLVQSIGGFIPELGESITTAQQKSVNRLAVQIVSMMEKPW
jgi:hypothetical protein